MSQMWHKPQLSFTSCVTLGKLKYLPGPSGEDNGAPLAGVCPRNMADATHPLFPSAVMNAHLPVSRFI